LFPSDHHEPSKILILDFGSQYTQLIARGYANAACIASCIPSTVSPQFIRDFKPRRHHPFRRPRPSVYEEETPRAPDAVFDLGVPVLGILLRHATMAAQLGGTVEKRRQARIRLC